MHARLAIGRPPAPMLRGGWYPVVELKDQLATLAVDGAT